MAHRCIHQLVYSRQREGVLWVGLIQIYEVHAHSPLPALLFYYYSIGQPFGVENLLDSPCLFELYHLFPDSVCMLFRWAPRQFFLGSDGWVNVQMMVDEIRVHPRGLISVPCKHINVSSKEFQQLFLLLRRQLSPDLKELLQITTYNKIFQILAFRLFGWSTSWRLWRF